LAVIDKSRLLAGGVVLLAGLLAVMGCGRRPVAVLPRPPAATVAAAWNRLAAVNSLESRGIIRMTAADGEKNAGRIRLLAAAPDRLKIQWLTPWQTVAWQLLLNRQQFWLTDSKEKTTYYGRLADWRSNHGCRRQLWWWRYLEMLAGWSELLRPPANDGRGERPLRAAHWPAVERVEYLVTADGRLPAGKIIRFANGEEWRLELADFEELPAGKVFPRRWTITTPRATLTLLLAAPRLNPPLGGTVFAYRQDSFALREFRCQQESQPAQREGEKPQK